MDSVIKAVMLILFFIVIFGRRYFPSNTVYWLTYFFMFVLIGIYWLVSFYVSKKKAYEVYGKTPDFDIFVGKVLPDVRADLQRGRLVFSDGEVALISKTKGKYTKVWSMSTDKIKSIGFGNAVGWRKGFIFHTDEGPVPFTFAAINKHRSGLYKALGWNVREEK